MTHQWGEHSEYWKLLYYTCGDDVCPGTSLRIPEIQFLEVVQLRKGEKSATKDYDVNVNHVLLITASVFCVRVVDA